MAASVSFAFLMCIMLVTCALARPIGCQDSDRSSSPLARLMRRSAAIASRLRLLRSLRERRWARSYPIWKTLHRVQERNMDISHLPPLPLPDTEQHARDFDQIRAAVEKDSEGNKNSWVVGDVFEGGSWGSKPVFFSEVPNPEEEKGAEVESDLNEGWDNGNPPIENEDNSDADWGEYKNPYLDCIDDNIVGIPCTRDSDCRGCTAYHCSASTNHCVAGPRPHLSFSGFI
ncbi:uncharacterized protein LOC110983685 [Acanthaster planci]|uniref:Uncharacterized protein LOC110983685 n=1 Tax=Acanthaster planci TaxID=133434 RepID=A0A8B7Z244_ACAPL|nr:uncharacterized protein LOC110983685 [Acanthaster planci]XP_022098850.1 uncharacterized protein LOC110983685 [Acanthaster planci]